MTLAPSDLPLLLAANDFDPQMLLRLTAALGLSLVIGIERENPHRAAGIRTHALVGLGSALFVCATLGAGVTSNDTSRVVQGVVQGIGFLGAGTILKLSEKAEVRGLTTAASIWITAAIGVACGLGEYWLAAGGTALAWFALEPLKHFEKRFFPSKTPDRVGKKPGSPAASDPDDA